MPEFRNARGCPEPQISRLLATMREHADLAARDLDLLIAQYPMDARLHFLRGSVLAGRQDYAGAQAAMRRAIELAPDYDVARFQLGLLLLTSGQAHAAQEIWGPLHALPADHYLRLFAGGLARMIHDEFADAARLLRQGIAQNHENAPMNRDMEMVIREIERAANDRAESALSSVDLLLQQAALKSSKH